MKNGETMPDQHKVLMACLENHRGKQNSIKSSDLLKTYNSRRLMFEEISSRTLRKLKEECNTLYGAFICSCDRGYFIANNPEEINESREYMYSYIKNISHETKMIEENFNRATVQKQMNLI